MKTFDSLDGAKFYLRASLWGLRPNMRVTFRQDARSLLSPGDRLLPSVLRDSQEFEGPVVFPDGHIGLEFTANAMSGRNLAYMPLWSLIQAWRDGKVQASNYHLQQYFEASSRKLDSWLNERRGPFEVTYHCRLFQIVLPEDLERLKKERQEYVARGGQSLAQLKAKSAARLYESHCWRCKTPINSVNCDRCVRCDFYHCRMCGTCLCR